MARDPLIDALIAELDQGLATLQAARKVVAELQRSLEASDRRGGATDLQHAGPASASLRYSGMTVPEAAKVLGVSEEQVRRLLRSGELLGVPFGGRVGWRLPRESVRHVAELWEAQRRGRDTARKGRRKR